MTTSRVDSFGNLPDLADDPQLEAFPEIKIAQVSDLPVRERALQNIKEYFVTRVLPW